MQRAKEVADDAVRRATTEAENAVKRAKMDAEDADLARGKLGNELDEYRTALKASTSTCEQLRRRLAELEGAVQQHQQVQRQLEQRDAARRQQIQNARLQQVCTRRRLSHLSDYSSSAAL